MQRHRDSNDVLLYCRAAHAPRLGIREYPMNAPCNIIFMRVFISAVACLSSLWALFLSLYISRFGCLFNFCNILILFYANKYRTRATRHTNTRAAYTKSVAIRVPRRRKYITSIICTKHGAVLSAHHHHHHHIWGGMNAVAHAAHIYVI